MSDFIQSWYIKPEDDPELAGIWLELRDPQGWWKARVRDSGCVDLSRYHNLTADEQEANPEDHRGLEDYLHICEVDDLIARLQALKVFAKQHFGEEWA